MYMHAYINLPYNENKTSIYIECTSNFSPSIPPIQPGPFLQYIHILDTSFDTSDSIRSLPPVHTYIRHPFDTSGATRSLPPIHKYRQDFSYKMQHARIMKNICVTIYHNFTSSHYAIILKAINMYK